jgi:hypothetical protein
LQSLMKSAPVPEKTKADAGLRDKSQAGSVTGG